MTFCASVNVRHLLSIAVVNDVLLSIRTKLLCLFWIYEKKKHFLCRLGRSSNVIPVSLELRRLVYELISSLLLCFFLYAFVAKLFFRGLCCPSQSWMSVSGCNCFIIAPHTAECTLLKKRSHFYLRRTGGRELQPRFFLPENLLSLRNELQKHISFLRGKPAQSLSTPCRRRSFRSLPKESV